MPVFGGGSNGLGGGGASWTCGPRVGRAPGADAGPVTASVVVSATVSAGGSVGGLVGGSVVGASLGGGSVDPFDLDTVNVHLKPAGWVYGAGWVDTGRPGFFLAELLRHERGPPSVQHCGTELARCLFAPPAALQGGHTIVLRRDALAR